MTAAAGRSCDCGAAHRRGRPDGRPCDPHCGTVTYVDRLNELLPELSHEEPTITDQPTTAADDRLRVTGERVQIMERDRDPERYPFALVVRAETRPDGTVSGRPGYKIRYEDGGSEVWQPPYNVCDPRPVVDRQLTVAEAAALRSVASRGGAYVGRYDLGLDGRLATMKTWEALRAGHWLIIDHDHKITGDYRYTVTAQGWAVLGDQEPSQDYRTRLAAGPNA